MLHEAAGVDNGGASGSFGAGESGGADAGESSRGGAVNTTSGGGGRPETAGSPGCANGCNAARACLSNGCESGWVAMSPPPESLVARSKSASVAMGKAVFIWGGLDNNGAALGNGAIYEPANDTWTPLPMEPGSPTPRIMATAVWTGNSSNKVIVYGGTDASGTTVYRDGAVFDIAGNSWSALPSSASTSKRSAPFGYWDGTHAVFFGGLNATPAVVIGADRFDLEKWSVSTVTGDPGLLGFSAIGFDGTVMYLQGGVIGSTRQDKVYAYTSSTDKWATLSQSLSARTGAFGAWDGTRFVVWGGQDDLGLRDDGKMMSGTSWSDMSSSGAPSARRIGFRRSGWAFQVSSGVIAVLGGQTSISGTSTTSGTLASNGATYAAESGAWSAIPNWPSGEPHEYGIGVWTGEEFVIWGGRSQNVSTLTGERWAP